MTDRELRIAKELLPRWENGKPPVLSEAQKRISEELYCRGMINSILVYHGVKNLQQSSYFYQEYLKKYEQTLGRECVAKLCVEQTEDFLKACVYYGGTDGEGISYNSIMWADELTDEFLEVLTYDLAAEGPENGTGYTLPDGHYHIFAYVDFIDDDRVIVLEPNKVIDGAHEPIGGNTYIVDFGNTEELLKGCDWCLDVIGRDRHGLDAVLLKATLSTDNPVEQGKTQELDI